GTELITLDRFLSPRVFLSNTKKLVRLARWADVVHFQKSHHYAAAPAIIAAFVTGRALHYDWDDWETEIFYESSKRNFNSFIIGSFFSILEKVLPNLSDTVSVASKNLKNMAIRAGKKDQGIFWAPVGADLNKFNPCVDNQQVRSKMGIDGPFILYVGQLHGAQYVDILLRSALIVREKRPDARFVVVGDGFMREDLIKMRDEMGLKKEVIFTGPVLHDQIPFYVASADVCVAVFKDTKVTRCKSPLKIVEYMASGKAIVASNVGEIPYMLGGCGLLTEPGDEKSLAQGILKLTEDPFLRLEMGRCARRRAETFYSWKNTACNLQNAYEKAMQNGRLT
ncbi:MAG TPA: glycosyltransferase family 4 protein, partial [Candidatus Omnitrophota bacterium]|nr:glycosyltransferase family 4 protein [Candidatus Omnitrophota bacterium]